MKMQNNRGFTIIEVVLVLAIAGLIFLMVFIALPNMQMAQRNTQRRNDYNSLSTQITNYATNHNGEPPATTQVKATWFNAKGKDPDGNDYKFEVVNAKGSETGLGTLNRTTKQAIIFVGKTTGTSAIGFDCQGGDVNQLSTDAKKFVIKGYIEAGGTNGDFVCLESHI